MKNKLKIIICFILPLFLILFVDFNAPTNTSSVESEVSQQFSLDFSNTDNLPLNFRKTSDLSNLKDKNLDLTGLDSLNISGSGEFTSLSLLKLKENLNTPPPIVIVDLRQETHGFINGNSVSDSNQYCNVGLTFNDISEREKQVLSNIPFGKSISLGNENHSLIPTLVETEENLIRPNNLRYVRIPVKENGRPTDETVDRFVEYINTLKKDTWLHFHCKLGDERTTIFMSMYDMIKNSNNTELKNILTRQEALGGTNLLNLDEHDPKSIFIKNFYQYSRNADFKISWSNWIKQNNIEPYNAENELPK
ncbi:phytase [Clostridium sp. SHJSY1]|uniref:fused DSP-PTPase phosphatase/NAD kinase-like protein n=1 Tax=Clostridium sp. SHJSY1 TaxID=2942483 RepID=UPI0028744907|nr:phytase [Clostridium sp. SHJSY1]MDS0528161.1 phytase [Clostridium sp. SHJSY1]